MKHNPDKLTPEEQHTQELLRFENRERYQKQSKNTKDGEVATIVPRPRLRIYGEKK